MSDNFQEQFYTNLRTQASLKDKRIKSQTQNQLFHGRRKLVYMPIIERRPDFFQMDTTFYPLKGKKRAIFAAINVNTKQGFIQAYKGASPTANETVQFLKQLVAKYPVKHLGADNGSEFTGRVVQNYLKTVGIPIYYYTAYDSNEKSVVERFNGTVKNYLNKVAYAIDDNWIEYLDQIMEAYNTTKHSSIGKSPDEMTEQDVEAYLDKQQAKSDEYRNYLIQFQPNTQVRIYRDTDPTLSNKQRVAEKQFGKMDYPRWSSKIYTVENIDGYKVKLHDVEGRFSPRDLLIITHTEDYNATNPVPKKTVQKQRKIKQALSEIDQAPPKTLKERTTRSKGTAPELYKIEKILSRRFVKGRPEFQVKWKGLPNSSNTWEDAMRFVQTNQQKLLDKYLDAYPITIEELLS